MSSLYRKGNAADIGIINGLVVAEVKECKING